MKTSLPFSVPIMNRNHVCVNVPLLVGLVTLLMGLFSLDASADHVTLKTGEVYYGEVEDGSSDRITIRTPRGRFVFPDTIVDQVTTGRPLKSWFQQQKEQTGNDAYDQILDLARQGFQRGLIRKSSQLLIDHYDNAPREVRNRMENILSDQYFVKKEEGWTREVAKLREDGYVQEGKRWMKAKDLLRLRASRDFTKERNRLTGELEKQKSRLKKIKDQRETNRAKRKELKEKIAEQRDTLQDRKRKMTDLRETLSEEEEKYERASKIREQLRERLRKLRSADRDQTDVRKKIVQVRNSITKIDKKMNKLRNQISDLEDSIEEQEKRLKENRTIRSELKETIKEQQTKIGTLEDEIEDRQKSVDRRLEHIRKRTIRRQILAGVTDRTGRIVVPSVFPNPLDMSYEQYLDSEREDSDGRKTIRGILMEPSQADEWSGGQIMAVIYDSSVRNNPAYGLVLVQSEGKPLQKKYGGVTDVDGAISGTEEITFRGQSLTLPVRVHSRGRSEENTGTANEERHE